MTPKSKKQDEKQLTNWLRQGLYANAKIVGVTENQITFTHRNKQYQIDIRRLK